MISNVSSADFSKDETVGDYPTPPSRHWALAVLFHSLTFGIYTVVLAFRQAAWIRQIDPTSNAAILIVVSVLTSIPIFFVAARDFWPPLFLVGTITWFWAYFSMRRVLQDRFELSLSRVMTFFFNVWYFQYHMRRIAMRKYAFRGEASISLRSY